VLGRHDSQDYDIQHNDIQHNDIQHNDNQHNDIQHNDIQHNVLSIIGLFATLSIKLLRDIMLRIIILYCYGECHYSKYCYDECHHDECCGASAKYLVLRFTEASTCFYEDKYKCYICGLTAFSNKIAFRTFTKHCTINICLIIKTGLKFLQFLWFGMLRVRQQWAQDTQHNVT
jgi:hypothetical protein